MDPLTFADALPDLTIEYADARHKDELLDFLLDYFREEEPTTQALGLSQEEALTFFQDLVDGGLKDQTSFLVFSKETGGIVACRLNEVHQMDEPEEVPDLSKYSTKATKIFNFLEFINRDLKSLLPHCRKYMKFCMVSVHPNFYRRGIAQKLVELSLQLAKHLQCDYIVTTATAFNSQKMFDKLGFETLRTVTHDDYTDNGVRVIQGIKDGTTCGKLMVMRLT